MPNTYSQVYLHFVFAVKYRKATIEEPIRSKVEGYMATLTRNEGHHVHALYAMPDHVHLLTGYKVTQSIPDFVQKLKGATSRWINEQGLTAGHFHWQEAYGVFSHGPDSLEAVRQYILHQPEHHTVHSFHQEYLALLKKFKVDFDERYLFGPLLDRVD